MLSHLGCWGPGDAGDTRRPRVKSWPCCSSLRVTPPTLVPAQPYNPSQGRNARTGGSTIWGNASCDTSPGRQPNLLLFPSEPHFSCSVPNSPRPFCLLRDHRAGHDNGQATIPDLQYDLVPDRQLLRAAYVVPKPMRSGGGLGALLWRVIPLTVRPQARSPSLVVV